MELGGGLGERCSRDLGRKNRTVLRRQLKPEPDQEHSLAVEKKKRAGTGAADRPLARERNDFEEKVSWCGPCRTNTEVGELGAGGGRK
jgi:hypothetical protein